VTFDPNARLDPSQVEDRRRGGGLGRSGPVLVGGGGLGVLLLIAALLLGVDPFASDPSAMQPVDADRTIEECRTGADANVRDDCRIVGFVGSVQQYWSTEFARRGIRYTPARTVIFSGHVQAGCGLASAANGPFYCPLDGKIYLDLSFFQELRTRFGARGGPLVEGYVVAHEYGHHIQNELGLLSGDRGAGAESTSVRTELMADCLAGVWASHASTTGYLKPLTNADIVAALDAAAAVGDDRIQRETEGRVSPERWTHGSSEQRQEAVGVGLRTGDLAACHGRYAP
jgi:predicted metalloprotease